MGNSIIFSNPAEAFIKEIHSLYTSLFLQWKGWRALSIKQLKIADSYSIGDARKMSLLTFILQMTI
jgi:ABC-type Fe3+ transport system permease subunit